MNDSVTKSTAKGIAWTSIGTLGAGFINLLITMVLSRILTPNDFGTIELLMVFSSISEIIINSGFSQALIRDNDASDIDFNTVFWINLSIAIFLYLLLFFLAPSIAYYFKLPKIKDLARIIFLGIIFNSFSIVQNARFSREINFKPFAVSSILSLCVSGIVAILLALNGYGVWALAINLVLVSLFRSLLLWLQSKWVPSIVFSIKSAKKYLNFGSNLLFQQIIDKIVTNIEIIFIGKVYTSTELAYFSQARKLDSYIIQLVTTIIQKVTYPALAAINSNQERLKNGYRRIIGLSMFIITPIVAFSAGASDNIIIVLFGKKWLQSSNYLKLWNICGWLVSLYSIYINIILVCGKSKLLLIITFIRQSMRIIAIILLLKYGIMTILYGILITTLISTLFYIKTAGRLINYSFKELSQDIFPTIIVSIISAANIILVDYFININNSLITLIIKIALMSFFYFGMMLIIRNKNMSDLKNIIYELIKNRRR